MESIYRSILKQAVNIAWKFKYLWFFGLFAALAGNGGIYNIGINNIQYYYLYYIFYKPTSKKI